MHSLLDQLREAADPTYYQDTFYFTILISMSKDLGGSRDETKNDIRALPEVLTVTLVEAEKGGVQRDIGSKYLSTLKVHARRPKNMNKRQLMKRLVLNISNLRGVSVMRYKESKPKQRRKPFRGQYDISETSYQQNPRRKANLRKAFNRYTKTGPNKSGPFKDVTDDPDWKSAPPGAPGGLEEAQLDEAMKTAYDVALELAGDGGLKPDPLDVSDEASAVWKHYATQRDDVSSQPLVDTHEFDLVMPPERAENPEENDHLSHKYIKTGKTTIEELRGQGQFIELKSDSEVPTPSPREELTDLAAELDIPIVSNKDLSRFDRLYEQVLITIGHGQDDDDLMAFDVQPTLNQKIWDGDLHIRPGTKGALMHIVEEFMDGLDMDLDLKDVIVTGSIANFNWSKFSDIDLHLLVDFGDVNDNEEMVKKFFDAVRSNWNKLHNILVKGHEVEIYVQDDQEPHISTGVYSLMDDKWLVKPKKIKPELDRVTAIKKMRHFAREIDKLSALFDRGDHEGAYEMAQRLKSKLKRMRQGGLERAGIYSPENLAFKMLRRSGDIEQLFSIYTQAYDHIHSLDQ